MSVTPTPPVPPPAPAPSPVVVPAPSMTPEYAIAAVTTLVGLFATQGLLSNNIEKLVTGSAAVLIPLVFVIVQGIVKSQAHKAKVSAVVAGIAPEKLG